MVNLAGSHPTTSSAQTTLEPAAAHSTSSRHHNHHQLLVDSSSSSSRHATAVESSSPSSTISSLSSLSAASASLPNLNGHHQSSREPRHNSHHNHNHHQKGSMSRNNANMNHPAGHHSSSMPPGQAQNPNRSGQAPYHHSSGAQPHFNHHHHHGGGGGGGGGSGHYYQGNNNQPGGGANRSNPSTNAAHPGRMHHNNNNNNHHHPPHNHGGGHHPQQQQRSQPPPSAAAAASTAATASAQDAHIETIDFHCLETIEYPFCTDHSKYEHIAKIGQGTFGEVYKAKCKKTQELVALKKVLTENEKEGFPITALREIKILQVLRHENIVRLIEICTTKATAANKYKSNFYLVFEFCEHDLAGLLSNPMIKFTLGEQKKIMHQLLNGLYYIHKNYILHRDMKTANILVTKEGKLKLADFGLARAIEQKSDNQAVKYTNRVVTLWYRPPELLLGERCYTRAIDMWGAGCIMAELWTKEPILKGNSEQSQLDLIQTLCGSIDASVWPDVDKLELFNKMQLKSNLNRKVKERLGHFIKDQCALNLLDKLLTLDPKKRIDSDEALDDDFFWSDPMPTDLKLDKIATSNFEFTAQNNRRGQMHRQVAKPVGNEQHYDRVY